MKEIFDKEKVKVGMYFLQIGDRRDKRAWGSEILILRTSTMRATVFPMKLNKNFKSSTNRYYDLERNEYLAFQNEDFRALRLDAVWHWFIPNEKELEELKRKASLIAL